jgi:hypothetical protein
MKHATIVIIIVFAFVLNVNSQICGVSQTLTPLQESQLKPIKSLLDSALKYENLFQIDSLSRVLKNTYGTQGGRPDVVEVYYNLVTNNNKLNISDAIKLSRVLIANDSLVYANLWKLAKGMNPPAYKPHSLFLRSSAEIASGLLKIADKETDLERKLRYQSWATRAFDSLATMQLPNGAFPFPDLRTYGDQTFSSIIQNMLNSFGSDSVKVLQNGWIINDKNQGEFKFDAGVIANAFFEAYQYTHIDKYKNVVIAVGRYLKSQNLNFNYNYNTFASLGLTRAYQLSNDTSYLNRAIKILRYSVFPGQVQNGRWVDSHNANSRYHSIIIQNIVPTIQLIPESNRYKSDLEFMTFLAVKNMVEYTYNCGTATGYRWLIKSTQLNSNVIPNTLKDSVSSMLFRHISLSALNGKYLDVPTMGEYIELLGIGSGFEQILAPKELGVHLYPNLTRGFAQLEINIPENNFVNIQLLSINGRPVESIDRGHKIAGKYYYKIDISKQLSGLYFIAIQTNTDIYIQKIIKYE